MCPSTGIYTIVSVVRSALPTRKLPHFQKRTCVKHFHNMLCQAVKPDDTANVRKSIQNGQPLGVLQNKYEEKINTEGGWSPPAIYMRPFICRQDRTHNKMHILRYFTQDVQGFLFKGSGLEIRCLCGYFAGNLCVIL